MNGELKPCPWCGGNAELDEVGGATGLQHFASCKDMTCPGYHYEPYTTYARKAEAIAAWNKRAGSDWSVHGPRLLEALEKIGSIETFCINPVGRPNIVVEGGDRFAHERDVKRVFSELRAAIAAAKGGGRE